ncbi:DinB family protein [Candidatus Thorarchaeota archaeon]|nr:MAG: DinB family protein [Candidatus Thorarchaeota archaeon]
MTGSGHNKIGDVIRFGLGARNWLFAQMDDADHLYKWKPPDGGRSAEEVLNHIAWVISAVCSQVAGELRIELHEPQISDDGYSINQLKSEISASYEMFTELCEKLDTGTLERKIKLPPPARVREGSIESILRIMTGYHVIHHAGQVAMLLRMARNA